MSAADNRMTSADQMPPWPKAVDPASYTAGAVAHEERLLGKIRLAGERVDQVIACLTNDGSPHGVARALELLHHLHNELLT